MPETAQKPKVLVADDERVIADTLAMILNQSGFQARVAYTGEKAVELAAEYQPEMLISDVIMAGLNGIDAAIKIREILPNIKILLFSGQAATADLLEKARARGYEFEILAKPVQVRRICWRGCGGSAALTVRGPLYQCGRTSENLEECVAGSCCGQKCLMSRDMGHLCCVTVRERRSGPSRPLGGFLWAAGCQG